MCDSLWVNESIELRKPVDDTPGEFSHSYIDTEEDFVAMVLRLQTSPCIAVDIEHHHIHSYQGIASFGEKRMFLCPNNILDPSLNTH